MIILSPATSAQTFTFIPRNFVITGSLVVTDEETREVQTNTVYINHLDNLGSINVALDIEIDKWYELELNSVGSDWDAVVQSWNLINIDWEEALSPIGAMWSTVTENWNVATGNWDSVRGPVTQVIYRDRIFCTNQTISQRNQEYYNSIKGLYDESTAGSNKYKVYNR